MTGSSLPRGSVEGTWPAFPADAFDDALASVDALRRASRAVAVPLAEVYVEGARGALHHAREAMLHAVCGPKAARRFPIIGTAVAVVAAGEPLLAADLPTGWVDDVPPAGPDLGSDLMGSREIRAMSRGVYLGGMLAGALAHHAWLHLASGVIWSTDRGGALALVGALSEGRAIPLPSFEETLGALEERVVRAIAALGWRRFRSPRFEPAHRN